MSKAKKTQADELMDIARPVLKRLDTLWFSAFDAMMVAEIQLRRDPERRAKVEAAGMVAHTAAAAAYSEVYRRVLAEEMKR